MIHIVMRTQASAFPFLWLIVSVILGCVPTVAQAQRSDLVLNVDDTGRWECLQAVGSRGVIAEGQYFLVIQTRLPDPAPGFRAYDVTLSVHPSAPAGSFVSAFEQLNFSGVHQVWDSFRNVGVPTPFPDYFRHPSLVAALGGESTSLFVQNLDSHLSFDVDEYFGSAPSETNNGGNPGQFETAFGQSPALFSGILGLGELGVINRMPNGNSVALGLFAHDREAPLARVVIWHDGLVGARAILSGTVGGRTESDPNRNSIETFRQVAIGGAVPIPLGYNRMCPEPVGRWMAIVGWLGLICFSRRARQK